MDFIETDMYLWNDDANLDPNKETDSKSALEIETITAYKRTG